MTRRTVVVVIAALSLTVGFGAQKYIPRQGANPAYLVGKPVYSAWK